MPSGRRARSRPGRPAGAPREAGARLAPADPVGDERFVGRQHLPMIRWNLGR